MNERPSNKALSGLWANLPPTLTSGAGERSPQAEDANGASPSGSGVPNGRLNGPSYSPPRPAAAMVPAATDGAAAETLEFAGHAVNRDVLVFGAAAPTHAQFQLALPGDWDLGPMKFKAYWQGAAGAQAGEAVTWAVRAKVAGQGRAIDAAWGAAAQLAGLVSATGGGVQEISGPSPALTPAGEPGEGCLLDFDLYRLIGGPGDSPADAWLHGVLLQYLAVAKPEAW